MMSRGNLVPVPPRACKQCGEIFTPKIGGYNAAYCGDTCKRRSQRARLQGLNPDQLKQARRRSYQQIKAHSDRHAARRANGRKQRTAVRQWLADYKMAHGCADCGYREHPAALQLDHEGTKTVEISEARSSIARLKAEIEAGQCKVRCANCHSIRTWERKQLA